MSTPADRAASLRKLIAHVREALGLDLGFVLWDGSTVPATLPGEALAMVLTDEGVVAALVRRPNFDTLADLWATARIDLRNGSVADLLARRPAASSREFRKRLDRWLLARVLVKFLFLPAGGPWPLRDSLHGRTAPSSGSESENKENVQFHYDLSNAFYALFLDPEMVYSCGYFVDWRNDIATAQRDKLDMTCRKLRLQPGDTLLDVGCGWGALVCHAAQHYGVSAHGVTLAQQQFDYATEKVARLGLQDRVTLELRDYSTLEGSYDKIASIGMFEHVGIANHPAYFATISRLLRPRGLYLHHAIVRRAKRNDKMLRNRSREYQALIRYIFPGAEVDHIGMSIANLEHQGLEVRDVEGWREHYHHTCKAWHERLLANRDAAEREVGSVRTRLWLAYLAACAYGFEGRSMGIYQTLAVKRERGASGLPPTRVDLYR
jgi:cyclopropane-fatty-acyl-phospholipid synthase